MPKKKYDSKEALRLYEEARKEILDNFNNFTLVEAQQPELFFSGLHKVDKSLKVIDAIVRNVLVV